MKPLKKNSAAENELTTPKRAFGKPISQCGLSTKSLKPRRTDNTREKVISASKSAFVPNKLTEQSCNRKQNLDCPALSAPKNKQPLGHLQNYGLKTAETEF
ncbi:hypothetical protein [Vibrio vulnificus]|uniref:hypothetical protein n=1 Tax=Vibrio vulnificus TaxID=672 RepID=UPI0028B48E2E|nr:hypothetical protein [Vibrio vulnificus]